MTLKKSFHVRSGSKATSNVRPSMSAFPHLPALDGLRAVAILLVFLYHASILSGGWIGVDIFFVLSGYLITSLLISEHTATGRISVRQFYFRRARRLFPGLFVFIGVTLILTVCLRTKTHDSLVDAVAALFHFANYRYAFHPVEGTPFGHVWSLSMEEQFYLIWPVLLIGLLKFQRNTAPWVVLALIGLITVWRIFLFYRLDGSFYRIYFAFDTRADELLVGCLAALSKDQIDKFPILVRLWPISVVVIALSALKLGLGGPGQPYIDCVGFSVLAAAAACVIVTLAEKPRSILASVLTFPLMVGLGRISYGFYLWHYMIFHEPSLSQALIPRTLEVFLLTLLASLASYYFVERPFRSSKPA